MMRAFAMVIAAGMVAVAIAMAGLIALRLIVVR
jgi:hypothetical protein